jgi:hypothetical protein
MRLFLKLISRFLMQRSDDFSRFLLVSSHRELLTSLLFYFGQCLDLKLPMKRGICVKANFCCRKVLAMKHHMHIMYYIQHSCDPAPMLLPRCSDFHNASMSEASWGVWTSGRLGYWARKLMAFISSGRILALRSGSLLLCSWQGHATHTESHTAQLVREDGTPIFG